jgi:hypothetical protein
LVNDKWFETMRKNTEAQVRGGVADGSEEGPVMGLERSGDVVQTESVGQPGNGEEPARAVKPFDIAKRVVVGSVPACQSQPGAAGIDGESMEMFEANLKSTTNVCGRSDLIADVGPIGHDLVLHLLN